MLLKLFDAVQFLFHPEFVIPYLQITPECLLKVQAESSFPSNYKCVIFGI